LGDVSPSFVVVTLSGGCGYAAIACWSSRHPGGGDPQSAHGQLLPHWLLERRRRAEGALTPGTEPDNADSDAAGDRKEVNDPHHAGAHNLTNTKITRRTTDTTPWGLTGAETI
jgi:hypothetical protein